jgi:hypothetical protein
MPIKGCRTPLDVKIPKERETNVIRENVKNIEFGKMNIAKRIRDRRNI